MKCATFPQPKTGKVNEIECRDNKELDEEGKGIETADNTTVLIEKLCRHLLLLFTSFVLYLTLHLTIFIGLAAAKSKLTHSSASLTPSPSLPLGFSLKKHRQLSIFSANLLNS